MKIEQKAKAYDEALKKARDYYEKGYLMINAALEKIFPNIKESEDERIRKELIEFVNNNTLSVDERHYRWIDWLQKQGEKKPEAIRQIIIDEIRAKMAIEIYIHGLVNHDGTYTEVNADAAVMHADSIIKALNL